MCIIRSGSWDFASPHPRLYAGVRYADLEIFGSFNYIDAFGKGN
jgi:hypothetical protein